MKLESWPTALPGNAPEPSSQALDRWVCAASDAWRQEMEKVQSEGWFHPVGDSTGNKRMAIGWLARDAAPRGAAGVVSKSSDTASPGPVGATSSAPEDGSLATPQHGPVRSTAAPIESAGQLQLSGAAAQGKVPNPEGPVSYRAAPTDIPCPTVSATGHTAPTHTPLVTAWGLVSEEAPKANDTLHAPDLSGADSASPRAALAASDEHSPPVRIHVEGDARSATVWLGVDAAVRPQVLALQHAVALWLSHSGYSSLRWVCNGAPLAAPPHTAPSDPGDASVAPIRLHQQAPQGLPVPTPAVTHPSGES